MLKSQPEDGGRQELRIVIKDMLLFRGQMKEGCEGGRG